MPGLAAAGFKPAVYTNFTTLAHRRMILEDCAVLEAMALSRSSADWLMRMLHQCNTMDRKTQLKLRASREDCVTSNAAWIYPAGQFTRMIKCVKFRRTYKS